MEVGSESVGSSRLTRLRSNVYCHKYNKNEKKKGTAETDGMVWCCKLKKWKLIFVYKGPRGRFFSDGVEHVVKGYFVLLGLLSCELNLESEAE